MEQMLPEDAVRHILAFIPNGWLTIDLRLEMRIPPGKLDTTLTFRKPTVIRYGRDGGSAVVLYVFSKKWKTILVVFDRHHRFVENKTFSFYYPKYELI